MSQSQFHPTNTLEERLVEAQQGKISFIAFLHEMLHSDVFIMSNSEFGENRFFPMQLERNGETFVATFTSLERMARYAKTHPYSLSLVASELLRVLPPGIGVVMNPSWTVGFELPAAGIAEIRQDFLC